MLDSTSRRNLCRRCARGQAVGCVARPRHATPEQQRPTYGLTLGMADILQSREILILVSGRAKLECFDASI